MENGSATLVAKQGGEASLFLSSGGGIIGAGSRDHVRSAAKNFLSCLARNVVELKTSLPHPWPGPGLVRFYARRGSELLGSPSIPISRLLDARHPLAECFAKAQALLDAVQEANHAA